MSILRRALERMQPDAEQELARARGSERQTNALRQDEINRRIAETAVSGFISPDQYRSIKVQVTAEIPAVIPLDASRRSFKSPGQS